MILKIGALAVIGALAAAGLKKENENIALLIILAAAIAVLGVSVAGLMGFVEQISDIFTYTGGNSAYLKLLLKCLGISIITQFASDICEDSGYRALASQVVLAGKVTIISLSLPLMTAVLQRCMEMIVQ